MILHTVNKSPLTNTTLASCLAHAAKGSSVILIEDGVYAALDNTAVSNLIKNALPTVNVYVLEPDLSARGLQNIISGIKKVDYAGFVELTTTHKSVQSWF